MKFWNLIFDIIHLAFSKKSIAQRIAYLLRGFVYLPFLLKGTQAAKGKEQDSSAMNPAGDDIYHLF